MRSEAGKDAAREKLPERDAGDEGVAVPRVKVKTMAPARGRERTSSASPLGDEGFAVEGG